MARKFILIDQSVKNSGGHHLEYARRVLRAARTEGFETVLGVHKQCKDIADPDIDIVVKAFSHTFWENFASDQRFFGARERRILKILRTRKDQLLYDLLCSPLGFACMAAAQGITLPTLLSKYASSTSGKRLSPLTIVLGFTLVRLSRIGQRAKHRLKERPKRWPGLRKWGRHLFLLLFKIALAPVALFYLALRWRKIFGRRDFHADKFAEDLQRLCAKVQIAPGDLIFIPTLGNVELTGAALCAENLPISDLSWHFLFRRNLFEGREPAYQQQIEQTAATLQAFSAYRARSSRWAAFFYTDTDALTGQYNALGILRFSTLPIPHDESLDKQPKPAGTPKTIAYIGDARDEKGFPLLGRLVADLRAAGYTGADMRFVLQSNFNVEGGEYGSRIARSELAMEPPDMVQLLEGPFDSDRYTALVNNADIVLVPYDAQCYYARSSGIFAEALAAGVPVVACDKSWMSQEVLRYHQDYFTWLLKQAQVFQTAPVLNPFQCSDSAITPKTHKKDCWLMIEIDQRAGAPGGYLQVRWQSDPPTIQKADRNDYYFRQLTMDLRRPRCLGLIRLPNRHLTLSFAIDNGNGRIVPTSEAEPGDYSITIHELGIKQCSQFFMAPLFTEEADFATAVIEMMENYPAYSEQCLSMREQWRGYHSSLNLVRLLAAAE